MKFLFTHLLFVLTYIVGCVWAIVSFILFLVKDRPFDWISLWICGAGLLLTVINFFLKAASARSNGFDFQRFHKNFPR